MHADPWLRRLQRLGRLALFLALPLAPALAVAALAGYDLAGMPRAKPTTMGALEATTGLSPPRGLTITLQRSSH